MTLFRTSLFRTLRVASDTRVLEHVDGRFTRVIGPGRHRRRRHAEYHHVWVPERIQAVAPQEVLTADGVTIKVSAAIRWAVADPRQFVEGAADPAEVVYLAVQVALRDAVATVDVEGAVREARTSLGPELTERAREVGAGLGLDVRQVVVKDVVLPADLRAAYAELVTARTRGQARLEAARAETAALRSLANAARLLDEHPALARQRLVEALPPGSTVEVR